MIPSQSKSLASLSPVAHGFFGRQGGVSDGQFASLNCGYGSGDDVSRVRQNRDSVARQIGTVEANLLTAYQIHSAEAVHVKAAWTREEAPKADAMATTERGIALGILTADCAPVLLCDGSAGVIGAAHAGWKGALDGVLDAVVALMERLGADRSRIRAAIGPCIEQNSYEVGPEFFQRFIEAAPGNSKFFIGASRDGHKLFDLPGFVESRLKTLDVRDVERLSLCTYVNEADYYSFRRSTHRGEPGYGRNMSAIMLKAS